MQRFKTKQHFIYSFTKQMKKLVLMAAAIVAVSFASCGNKAAEKAEVAADSTVVVEAVADTTVADSTVVVAE